MNPAQRQRLLYPSLAAIAAVAASSLVFVRCEVESLPIALPVGALTFGVVVSGFVATQRNMLLTMTGSEVLRFAVRTGFYTDVIDYLMDGIRLGLAMMGAACVGVFVLASAELAFLQEAWLSLFAGLTVATIWTIGRNEILVARMVTRYMEGQPTTDSNIRRG